ncbi:MAG: sigma-70 family RNA polymerase sigma factor [Allosphingosinicella sp.]
MRLDMEYAGGIRTGSEEGRRLAGTLSAVALGDNAAMADLYDRTSPKLFGICLRLLGSRTEAEEALQETYVTVWGKAGTFDAGKASAITWLATVARNKSIDRLRRRRPDTPAGLEAAADIPDSRASALDVLEDAQEGERLSGCLDELEDRAGQAIRSAFLDGASYSDLAEREGVPLGTMKSWIRRGLLRLRGCLER